MFLSVAAGAFVKGVAGVGLPIISVPVMAAVLGVEHAVAVMIIPSMVANTSMLWVLRREASANRELMVFIALGVVGTVLGAWILSAADQNLMFLVLAIWVVAYLVVRTLRSDFQISDRRGSILAPIVGFVAAAAGLTIVFRRWKAEAVSEATAADEALVAAARRERHDD